MDTRQPGLRKRMQFEARRIFHQHEQLDNFFEVLMDAVAGSDVSLTQRTFHQFKEALEAHFAAPHMAA